MQLRLFLRHTHQMMKPDSRWIKQHPAILVIVIFLLGVATSSAWFTLHMPKKPLYVELLNDTNQLIPSVIIEHGNDNLQEKISAVQLKPHESRIIALNHKPGMGFNVAVNYANGDKTEICAGKNRDAWFTRATITKFGIYNTPIR